MKQRVLGEKGRRGASAGGQSLRLLPSDPDLVRISRFRNVPGEGDYSWLQGFREEIIEKKG